MLAGARHVVFAGGCDSVSDPPLAVVEVMTHMQQAQERRSHPRKQSNLSSRVHNVKHKQYVCQW